MGSLDAANYAREDSRGAINTPSSLDIATKRMEQDTAALDKVLANPKSSLKQIEDAMDRLNASTDIQIKTLLNYLNNQKSTPTVYSNSTNTIEQNPGGSFSGYSNTVFVQAVPPLPPPPPPPTTVKIKSATPENILWDESLMPVEILTDLIFEDIGGQELLSVTRHDTVNGENVSNQLIKNLTFLNQEYSSKKIIGLQNTSDKYFSNFSIRLESKIPFEGNGPAGNNIYIDSDTQDLIIELINLEVDERLEIQIGIGGTIYTITLGAVES